MADFKGHLAGGLLAGAGVSAFGYFMAGLPLIQSGAVFIVGSIGGLLPDLDSDTGKPLSFLFELVSVLVPSLLLARAIRIGGDSPEFLVCYFAAAYLFLNYFVCGIIKRVTVHRGIMHSIPFALIFAGIGYLLFRPSSLQLAVFTGIAIFLGCLIHLLLDEITSIRLKFGFIPVPSRSGGSALKFKSESVFATLFVYLLLIILGVAIFQTSNLNG